MKAHTVVAVALGPWLVLAVRAPAAKESERAGRDYFPLRQGDSWTYRSSTGDGEYSLKVVLDEKQPDGSVRYLVEMQSGVIVHSWFSKSSGWVLMHGERYPEHEGLQITYDPARQYLPRPLVADAQWRWQGKDSTQTERNESNHVVGFEKVTVPAGKFRALKVVSQIEGGVVPMTRTCWYADGVGLVKSTSEGGQIKYGWALADYSFKKDAGKSSAAD